MTLPMYPPAHVHGAWRSAIIPLTPVLGPHLRLRLASPRVCIRGGMSDTLLEGPAMRRPDLGDAPKPPPRQCQRVCCGLAGLCACRASPQHRLACDSVMPNPRCPFTPPPVPPTCATHLHLHLHLQEREVVRAQEEARLEEQRAQVGSGVDMLWRVRGWGERGKVPACCCCLHAPHSRAIQGSGGQLRPPCAAARPAHG